MHSTPSFFISGETLTIALGRFEGCEDTTRLLKAAVQHRSATAQHHALEGQTPVFNLSRAGTGGKEAF